MSKPFFFEKMLKRNVLIYKIVYITGKKKNI